jgi:hypothetical protein
MSIELNKLLEISESLDFVPSEAMGRTKAKLMALIADNPVFNIQDMSLDTAVAFTKERRLRQWWKQDGFQEWFKSSSEFKAEVEDLVMLSLKRLRSILNSDNEKMASAQLGAAKLLFEAANKMPKVAPKDGKDALDKMDSEEMEAFIKRMGYVKIEALPDPVYQVISEEEVEGDEEESQS